MFHFLVTNLEPLASFDKFNTFLFHFFSYSVMINEFKEKCRIVFRYISAIKKTVAPLFFSNFPVTLIC